jgi:toxin ParE1/3/4
VKLKIRASARSDLDHIFDWISKDSPVNAALVIGRILDAMENTIAHSPFIGRKGKADGTREWPVQNSPYIVVYEVSRTEEKVTVVAVMHGAQNR